MSADPPTPAVQGPPTVDQKVSTPTAHWRRRSRAAPIPADHAARQGDIARVAFLALGRDEAIAFLNTENARLGGRPLAIATRSRTGAARVRAELSKLGHSQTNHQD